MAQIDEKDKRILTLAAEVAESTNKGVPTLLLKLKDILDGAVPGSKQLSDLKLEIWTYDLHQVLLLSIKQDFNRVTAGWSVAAKLANLLSLSSIGFDPPESHEFYGIFLPDCCESLLVLARKLQAKYLKTTAVLESLRNDLLDSLRTVLDSLSRLISGHDFLCANVLKSPWLLQMLITDDKETCLVVMGTMQSANRMKPGVLAVVSEQIVHGLLDELVYKLTSVEDPEVGSTVTRTVLVMCESHPPLVELICVRYKGLRLLLRQWEGKGFGRDLRKLVLLLQAGSARRAEMEKLHQAASVIQALWKGHKTRNKIEKAKLNMSKFQLSFRAKQEVTKRKKEIQRQQAELQHMLLMSRKKAMREARERQLQMLQIIPADRVNKHIAQEERQAATKLQAQWRGYRERRMLNQRRNQASEIRAVVTMQRAVRAWLDKLHKRRQEPPMWQRPPGLTDECRVELQGKITEWREENKPEDRSRQEQEDLHERVQGLLKQHSVSSKARRKTEQHREALLARLEMDATLLLNAPKLTDIKEADIETFTCRSVPIATKAQQNHKAELRSLRQPWWRKLGDEYQETDEAELGWRLF